ncbi:hypothetical protein DL767_011444 [Monosporascus sp. MG133]|nr:hypothetical protein DL767_011444 [Monosporascus sp. MG133]
MGACSTNVSGEAGNLEVYKAGTPRDLESPSIILHIITRYPTPAPTSLPSMKYLAAILSLVATASAIDLYLHTNNDCGGGNTLRCNGINPNVCCGTDANDSPFQSAAVRGIPNNWNI